MSSNTKNPYCQLYFKQNFSINQSTTMEEAQRLSMNISMIYNTFGLAIKDLIKLLSHLYTSVPTIKATHNISEMNDDHLFKQSKFHEEPEILQVFRSEVASLEKQQKKINKPKILNFEKYKLVQKPEANRICKKSRTVSQKQQAYENSRNSVERIQRARNKKQRERLNGYSCLMCEKFYEALGEDLDENGRDKLCDGCSRHRSNNPATKYFNDFSQQFGFDD